MSLSDVLTTEAVWCTEHIGQSGKGPDWESGFVAGLRQASYLIGSVEECCNDD